MDLDGVEILFEGILGKLPRKGSNTDRFENKNVVIGSVPPEIFKTLFPKKQSKKEKVFCLLYWRKGKNLRKYESFVLTFK